MGKIFSNMQSKKEERERESERRKHLVVSVVILIK
jgi:hypothetical protein